jgi:hypothetical protein
LCVFIIIYYSFVLQVLAIEWKKKVLDFADLNFGLYFTFFVYIDKLTDRENLKFKSHSLSFFP